MGSPKTSVVSSVQETDEGISPLLYSRHRRLRLSRHEENARTRLEHFWVDGTLARFIISDHRQFSLVYICNQSAFNRRNVCRRIQPLYHDVKFKTTYSHWFPTPLKVSFAVCTLICCNNIVPWDMTLIYVITCTWQTLINSIDPFSFLGGRTNAQMDDLLERYFDWCWVLKIYLLK